MKRCPQCGREYDVTMSYCLDDGSELLYGPSSTGNADVTAISRDENEPDTAILSHPASGIESKTRSQIHTTKKTELLPGGAATAFHDEKRFGKRFVAVPVLLVLGIVAGLLGFRYLSPPQEQIESIAVMPFVNESGNEDVEFLSDGMTETLIGSLTEIPNLSVKARSTVFYYKGKEKSVKEIGEELKVEAVLLGRVARRGDELTLNLELVNTKTLDAIWNETYKRSMSDLVMLQSEIAREVSDKLRAKLTPSQQQQVAKTYTTNSEAQQLYLQGRFYWNKRTVDSFQKAVESFKKSIALDPNFALAYSGLADTYALFPSYGEFKPREYMPLARQAAEKALELDPNSAEAHASLAGILDSYDYDIAGAERELGKAIELNPKYPPAHQWLAEVLGEQRKFDEALTEIDKALELDPFSLVINRVKGDLLNSSGRVDESIAQLKKTAELFPDDPSSLISLAQAYEHKGQYDDAVESYTKQARMSGFPAESIKAVKNAYAQDGWKGFWLRVLDLTLERRKFLLEKDKNAYVNNLGVALVYARLFDKDKTIEFLNRAYEDRSPGIIIVQEIPILDFLRDDPRFKELTEKIGFAK